MKVGRWIGIFATSVAVIAAACSGSGADTEVRAVRPKAPRPATGPVAVSLTQWSIAPGSTRVAAGSVTFNVKNQGTITHEFVVLRTDTPAANFKIGTFEGEAGRINEDTVGTNVGETGDMEAGTTKAITINLQPGHYALVCNLSGHYGQGMHIDLTVV